MKIVLIVAFLFSALFAYSQAAPFQDEINAFKREDSAQFPPTHAILFVGSSSFRMWQDVQDYFPGYTIINRGFGGSTLPDVIRFAPDIIFPYQPKQIVIYCGDNDLAADSLVTGKIVFGRFKNLYKTIRKNLGKGVNVLFVSIKPSPSRKKLLPEMKAANTLIKRYLSKEKNASYADVFYPMLNARGQMRPELYKPDMLHMKPAGYAIWQKVILPYLLK